MSDLLEPPVQLCYYECPEGHVEGIANKSTVVDQLGRCPICESALEILQTWTSSFIPVILDPENQSWKDKK